MYCTSDGGRSCTPQAPHTKHPSDHLRRYTTHARFRRHEDSPYLISAKPKGGTRVDSHRQGNIRGSQGWAQQRQREDLSHSRHFYRLDRHVINSALSSFHPYTRDERGTVLATREAMPLEHPHPWPVHSG